MPDRKSLTAVRHAPDIFQWVTTRVQTWISAWTNERADEGSSWLLSLVLHLAILVLLFLCPIALSGHTEADNIGALMTRLDSGNEAGLFDDGVSLEGLGPADEGRGDLDDRRLNEIAPGALWAGFEFAGVGSDDGDDGSDGESGGPAALAHLNTNVSSPAAVIEFDRNQDAQAGRKGRDKASRATQRKPGSGKEQPINVEGLLAGREPGARAKLAKSGGGTKNSERAVDLGLDWLVRHQKADGSWSFQHGPDDPGSLDCPNGATGLALLAFLGAGHTPQRGIYRSQVNLGLKYLVDHMEETNLGGWMQGTGLATMYVQGICAIALCEACSMTKDAALRRPAQLAIDFIVNAQDKEGGGWRYRIPQAGDTSVLGWQLMALQSARIAELNVPAPVFVKATRFLKSVEAEGGGMYGYDSPRKLRPATTAVGLLCRMYLGRSQEHKGMIRGMNNLSNWGPDSSEMYYSYYATQAMHHWGEGRWEKWNSVMREQLIASQVQTGDAAGSWMTDRSHGAQNGGRLYTTCLSIMTLEVYYRYLPIYRRPSVSEPEPSAVNDEARE
jgi:hypothetical protein